MKKYIYKLAEHNYLFKLKQYFEKLKANCNIVKLIKYKGKITEMKRNKENLEVKINQAFSLMQDSNKMLNGLEKKIQKKNINSCFNILQRNKKSLLEKAMTV